MEQFKVLRNSGPTIFEEVTGEDGFPIVFETEQEARDYILERDEPLRVGRVSEDGSTHILDDVTEGKE